MFRNLIAGLLVLFSAFAGMAQCTLTIPNVTVCGNGDAIPGAGMQLLNGAQNITSQITSVEWTQGGNPAGFGQYQVMNPTGPTTYTATVTTASGCTATANVLVNTNGANCPTASFTYSPTPGCDETAVSFNNTSTPLAGSSFFWSFGDGNTSTQQNPVHVFDTPDGTGISTYTVILEVTRNGVSTITQQTVSIQQSPPPVSLLVTNQTYCTSNLTATAFINLTNLPPPGWTNNFIINWGDGSPNTPVTPGVTFYNHIYPRGVFNLSISFSGLNGCVVTSSFPVFVGNNPSISIGNLSGSEVCNNDPLLFSIGSVVASNPPGTTYTAEFSDGSPNVVFSHPPPSSFAHSFAVSSCGFTTPSPSSIPNAFSLKVVAENPCGTSEARNLPIYIESPPESDFIISPSPACVEAPVSISNVAFAGYNITNGVCDQNYGMVWSISPSAGWTLSNGSFGNLNGQPTDPFAWTNGSSNLSLSFNVPGTYSITQWVGNSCGLDTLEQTICVVDSITSDFHLGFNDLCAPEQFTTNNLTTPLSGCSPPTYNWSISPFVPFNPPFNSASFEPSWSITNDGTYTITLVTNNACGSIVSDTTITLIAPPVISFSPIADGCAPYTVTPSVSVDAGGGNILVQEWSIDGGAWTSVNPSSPIQAPQIEFGSGLHSISVRITNECGISTATRSFFVSVPPQLQLNDLTLCALQTTPIQVLVQGGTGTPGFTWSWNAPGLSDNTISNPFYTPVNASNPPIAITEWLIVTVNDAAGCSDLDTIVATINPLPGLSTTSDSICVGDPPASLSVSSNIASTLFNWSPPIGLSSTSAANVITTANQSITYTITATDPSTGCSSSAFSNYVLNQLPIADAGVIPTLCAQNIASVLPSASPSLGVWSDPTPFTGQFQPPNQYIPINTSGSDSLVYSFTDSNGCLGQDTLVINISNPTPSQAGNDTAMCFNDPVWILDQGLPAGGIWSGNGVSQIGVQYIFSPSDAGIGQHTLTYTTEPNSTCETSDILLVTVHALPTVSAGNNAQVCSGDALWLDGNGSGGLPPYTYSWNPSTYVQGPTNDDSLRIQSPNTLVQLQQNYTLNLIDNNGCTASDVVMVTINPLPIVEAGNSPPLCAQEIPVTLTGFSPVSGGTGLWSGSPGLSGNVFTPTSTPGVVTLYYTFTDLNQCVAADSLVLTINPPVFPDAGANLGFCVDAPAVPLVPLNQTGGLWTGPGVSGSLFNPASAGVGSHTLVYTINGGTSCETSDSREFTVWALPEINLPATVNVCSGDTLEITAAVSAGNPPYIYNWSPLAALVNGNGGVQAGFFWVNQGPSAVNQTISLQVSDANACSANGTTQVTVNPLPLVEAGPDALVCAQNIEFLLSPSPAGGTWEASPQLSGNLYTPPLSPGFDTFTYFFTDANGCLNSDSVTFTIVAPVFPEIGPNLQRCLNSGTIQLQAISQPGGIWSGSGINGTGLFDPTLSGVGDIQLVYTINVNTTCEASDTLLMQVWDLPLVLIPEETICSGDSLVLSPIITGGLEPYEYFWTSQATLLGPIDSSQAWLSALAPNSALTLSTNLQVTDSNACVVSVSQDLNVLPLPVGSAGPDMSVCLSVQNTYPLLNFTPTDGIWTAVPGNSGVLSGLNYQSVALGTDSFVYTWSDALGCTNRDTLNINVTSAVSVTGGPDLSTCISANPIELPLNQPVNPPIIFDYYWTGPGVTNNLGSSVFSPSAAGIGTHNLLYVYEIGANCASTDSVTVTVSDAPSLSIASFTVCHNQLDTLNLDFTGGTPPYSVQWPIVPGLTPLSATQAQFLGSNIGNSSVAITLNVLVSDNASCAFETDLNLSTYPAPVVDAGGPDTLCNLPLPFALSGFNPSGGVWSGPGIDGSVFTPELEGDQTIQYTITDANGCSATDTRIMHIIAPTVPDAGENQTLCVNSEVLVLSGGSPAGGVWSGVGVNEVNGNFQFNPTLAGQGSYALVYKILEGTSCENSDSLIVQVNAAPQVFIGNDTSFCAGVSIDLQGSVLTGTPPYLWEWSGLGITGPNNASNLSIEPQNNSGAVININYTAQIVDAFGCTGFDTLQLTVFDRPVLNVGPSLQFCNQPIPQILNADPPGGFWSGSSNLTGNVYTPSQLGTETVIYSFENSNGCTAIDSVEITVVDLQVPDAGDLVELCSNDPAITLSPNTLTGGVWSGPAVVIEAGEFQFSPAVSGPGNFTLNYTVFEGTACEASDSRLISVVAAPSIVLPDLMIRCFNDGCEQLNASPPGGTYSGGSYISGGGELCLQGLAPGEYPVYYSYVDPLTSCTGYDTLRVRINEVPQANFSTQQPWCSQNSYTLINSSSIATGDLSFAWTIITPTGNLEFSEEEPSLTLNAGTYPAQLVASSEGCHDTVVQNILVVDLPEAAFDLSSNQGCAPIEVSITNLSTGYLPQMQWQLGSIYSSTENNPPNIVFPSPVLQDTLYALQLIASNACGADTAVQIFNAQPQPNAAIEGLILSGCSPVIPVLVNQSFGEVDNYVWMTSNGNTYTSFDFPGQGFYALNNDTTLYTVSLIANNTCGSDTATVEIMALPNLVSAFFNTDPPFGCADLNVNFTNATSGATSWTWNFGDGSPEVNAFNPSHTYENGGLYTIRMIATDGCSKDTAFAQVNVFPKPNADFQLLAPVICQGAALEVENLSTEAVVYLWNFGNGQSSLSFQPEYIYPESGNYTLQLIAFSPVYGCPDTIFSSITVQATPQIQIESDPQSGCIPLAVNFINNTLNANQFTWDFNNGESSQQFMPDVVYTQPGDYTVQFQAENYNFTNQLSCFANSELLISVFPNPLSNFNFESDTICGDSALVPVFNLSQGAQGYLWQWQNLNSTAVEPTIVVSDTGNTTITLIAQNIFGCTDTTSRQYRLIGQPNSDFVVNPPEGCAPHSALFQATSPYADRWFWNFGDGNTASGSATVMHEYSLPGSYTLSLNVSNDDRCFADTVVNQMITVFPVAVAKFNITSEVLSESDPIIELENQSINANQFQLDMGDGLMYAGFNAKHLYSPLNPDGYLITLIADNAWGCPDTTQQFVEVVPSTVFYIPSAFSPNADDRNEIYGPQFLDTPEVFEFLVFNRWGELIFKSTQAEILWDGTYQGKVVQQDVYVYSLSYQMKASDPPMKRPFIGRVTVLR